MPKTTIERLLEYRLDLIFAKHCFDISEVRDLMGTLNIKDPDRDDFLVLELAHCVPWEAMSEGVASDVKRIVLKVLNVTKPSAPVDGRRYTFWGAHAKG